MVQRWTGHGPELVRSWSGVGPELARSWSGMEQGDSTQHNGARRKSCTLVHADICAYVCKNSTKSHDNTTQDGQTQHSTTGPDMPGHGPGEPRKHTPYTHRGLDLVRSWSGPGPDQVRARSGPGPDQHDTYHTKHAHGIKQNATERANKHMMAH